jgi:hypothetical protein
MGPLARFRWPLLIAVAVVDGVLTRRVMPPDLLLFAGSGRDLLTGHLDRVYADAYNQGGPLQAVAAWLALPFGPSPSALLWLHILGNVGVVVLALLGARWLRRRSAGRGPSPALELLAGVVLVGFLMPSDLWNGHLSELAVPLLWMAAAHLMNSGRSRTAGLVLGLSAGFELWGVLALPLVLLGRGPRQVFRASVVAASTVLLLYLPFVLTGEFRMFGFVWPISPATLVGHVLPVAEGFPWWMRMVQGAASAGACAFVVLALRRRAGPDVVWLAPTATVLVRLALDPTLFSYYWTPAAIATLAGLVCIDPRVERRRLVLVGGLSYLLFLHWGPTTLPVLALALVIMVAAVVEARRRQTSMPVEGSGSPSIVAEVPRRTVSVPAGQRTRYWSPDWLS